MSSKKFVFQYMLGLVFTLGLYWLIGETITMVVCILSTVALWATLYFPQLFKLQQKIIRGGCTLRMLLNHEKTSDVFMVALIIETLTVGFCTLVFVLLYDWSIWPGVFMLGMTVYVHMVIKIRFEQIALVGPATAYYDA